VLAFGDNQKGQSTVPADLGSVRAVRAAREHSVALTNGGSIRLWGSNQSFQVTVPPDTVAKGERTRRFWAGGDQTILELAAASPDLDGDGAVGAADLSLLLFAWGPCGADACDADLDGDGLVGASDLALLLEAWREA
jgi:hypothetical protein